MGTRPLRADARRNRAHLVAVATSVFAEEGPEATLNEIARRAGVGPGTLYRHFPTRQELLVAVFKDRVTTLCAKAGTLAVESPPGEALTGWLRALLTHALTDRGLGTTMMSAGPASGFDCSAMMRSAAAGLLVTAQQAGAVRPDLEVDDLFELVTGLALATGNLDRATRLLSLTLDGLRNPV
jgi:AcrR family transcriptional regulator